MRWALLDGLTEDELREVLAGFTRRRFSRGEVVFHEDDPADTLHLVASGWFAARTTTRLGEVATFGVIGPGDWFGELALLGSEPKRTATVSALGDAETRTIHRLDLNRLRGRHPSIDEALISALVARVEGLSQRLSEALYVAADQRLLNRLTELAQRFAQPGEEAVVPLTQEELATLAGTSRATVNRVLGEQERAGTIVRRRGAIVIAPGAFGDPPQA